MIRQAQPTDLGAIMAIIDATVAVMATQGNKQWDENYPTQAVFAEDIARGALYVWCDDKDSIQGVACLDEQAHPAYSQLNWQLDERALIIHRLAVAPEARRQGIATQLMQFAERLARQKGLRQVRTDTYYCNHQMQALFQKMGYHAVGVCRFVDDLDDFYCYEKIWQT